MPRGDTESLGLSLCFQTGRNAHLSEYEQGRSRWTLMNLTTFFLVS